MNITICFVYCSKAAVLKKEKDQQRKVLKKERKTLRTVTKVLHNVYVEYRPGIHLWKDSLNSEGQQFPLYYQHEQSPNTTIPRHMELTIQKHVNWVRHVPVRQVYKVKFCLCFTYCSNVSFNYEKYIFCICYAIAVSFFLL